MEIVQKLIFSKAIIIKKKGLQKLHKQKEKEEQDFQGQRLEEQLVTLQQ